MAARVTDSWSAEVVAAWVTASCEAQGVPVKITDALVLRDVEALLGASGPASLAARAERGGRQARARTPRTAAARRSRSESPDGLHARGLDSAGSWDARRYDSVIENGGDDRGLLGQVEAVPRSA